MAEPERVGPARWGHPLIRRLRGEQGQVIGARPSLPGWPALDAVPVPAPRERMDPTQDTASEIGWFLEEHQFAVER